MQEWWEMSVCLFVINKSLVNVFIVICIYWYRCLSLERIELEWKVQSASTAVEEIISAWLFTLFIILSHPQSPRRSTRLHCSLKNHKNSPLLQRVHCLSVSRKKICLQICVSSTLLYWTFRIQFCCIHSLAGQDFTCRVYSKQSALNNFYYPIVCTYCGIKSIFPFRSLLIICKNSSTHKP